LARLYAMRADPYTVALIADAVERSAARAIRTKPAFPKKLVGKEYQKATGDDRSPVRGYLGEAPPLYAVKTDYGKQQQDKELYPHDNIFCMANGLCPSKIQPSKEQQYQCSENLPCWPKAPAKERSKVCAKRVGIQR